MTSEFGSQETIGDSTIVFSAELPSDLAGKLDVFVLVSGMRAWAEGKRDDEAFFESLWQKVQVTEEGKPNEVRLNGLDVETIGRLILNAKQMVSTPEGDGKVILSTDVEVAMPEIFRLLSSACVQQGGKVDEILQKRISSL